MSTRLRGIARETERIVAAGGYRASDGREVSLTAAVEAARAGTRTVGPEPVHVPAAPPADLRVEVTGESSLEAARRLVGASVHGEPALGLGGGPVADGTADLGGGADLGGEPVAVLNFASARNPGGGFLNGAQAQEEALCRASALYTCLLEARGFYDHHRAHRDPLYTDRVIHSPAVPVFRDDRGRLLDEPYAVGFLTAAAPNAGVVLRTTPRRAGELPPALSARAERVLETAAAHGYRRLVLGAWGCGVFRNDPAQVAEAFRALLAAGGRFEHRFAHVVFGVLDRTPGGTVRAAFEHAFGRTGDQVQP
ncbi:TIGR02452 family protein [Streptomyces sp. NPDC020597]|uniref:TIGR02452 family protein n=1 Tax=unclassified Streptomyces TaxID=2593676 RepID=UPI0037A514CB